MIEWMIEYKKRVVAVLAALAGVIYFVVDHNENNKPQNEETVESSWSAPVTDEGGEMTKNETPKRVMVDVKGAVKIPGVYEASESDRVKDIIEKAGGLTEHADQNQVNLAQHLQDEMVLYVPIIGEAGSPALQGASLSSSSQKEGLVNLNTADENELQTLPGIGPSKSAAILEYRETNGLFKTIDDLKNISGIGEKTFEKLKESITVK